MGRTGTHPKISYRKRRWRRVQQSARTSSFVLDNPHPCAANGAVGEAYLEQDDAAHGTLVPQIRVLSVERDLPSRLGLA